MEEQKINKDLILRERLAIERTVMANQRTFLSFLRTSLYFAIASLSIQEFFSLQNPKLIVLPFWLLSALLLVVGSIAYTRQNKKIETNKKHIGNFKMDYEQDL